MKNPKELRARAERYRGHARAMSDATVREVIRTVADKLEQEARQIEKETERGGEKQQAEIQEQAKPRMC